MSNKYICPRFLLDTRRYSEQIMKTSGGLGPALRKFVWATILLLPGRGIADTRSDELKRCLQDFDGIEWRLPYQPPIYVRSCASQTATYDTSEKTTDGHRSLELIGELTLGRDTSNLSSDETYAALQHATFTHFEAIFRRHGYRRTVLEHGDARTRYDQDSLRMLRGLPPLSAEASARSRQQAAALPPIPYVKLARFVRSVEGQDVTLTYKTDAKNTWKITLDGLPSGPAMQGIMK